MSVKVKCPNCMAAIPNDSDICEYCDCEIKISEPISSASDFFIKLSDLESNKGFTFSKFISFFSNIKGKHVRYFNIGLGILILSGLLIYFFLGAEILTFIGIIVFGLLCFIPLLIQQQYMNPDKKIESFINSYPTPSKKRDILEFLSYAVPRAKSVNMFKSAFSNPAAGQQNTKHNKMAPIWIKKCEQIIIKARFSLKNDEETLSVIDNYAKELKIT